MSDRTQKPPKGTCLVSCTLVSCLSLITQQVGKNRVEIKAEKWPSPSLPSLAPTVSEPITAEAGKQPNLMWNSIPDYLKDPAARSRGTAWCVSVGGWEEVPGHWKKKVVFPARKTGCGSVLSTRRFELASAVFRASRGR